MTRLCAVLAVISPAFAHTGHDSTFGVRDGLLHPVHWLDHPLAMVAVGLLAWPMGVRARGALPLSFVSVMAVGAAAAAHGLSFPMAGAELAIVASVSCSAWP